MPAACLFDLGRGGEWRARPDGATGRAAVAAAAAAEPGAPVECGCVGAGTGAVVGGLRGGVGTASTVLEGSGVTVAALVVANGVGSPLDPVTGVLYGAYGDPHFAAEGARGGGPAYPDPAVHAAAMLRLAEARERSGMPPMNTTLVVVGTDAELTRAQAQKVAGTAHDGIARAVRPVHLLNDGDTVFTLATGARPLTGERAPGAGEPGPVAGGPGTPAAGAGRGGPAAESGDPLALNAVLAASADVVSRAIVRAVLAAEGLRGAGGDFPSYRGLYGPLPGMNWRTGGER
ncbi:hypothetical protein BJP39_25735 [Streptomyces sp. CC77]|nr:hypothetical protein BJP39_25735 [Streptomyces sp. CC77]